jgi:hypothetical protein
LQKSFIPWEKIIEKNPSNVYLECYGISWKILWNSVEFHGILWNSMKFSIDYHGIPWNFSWNSMKLRLMEIHGFHGKFNGIPWNSMKFHGFP